MLEPSPYPAGFIEQLHVIAGTDAIRTQQAMALLDPGVDPRNFAGGLMVRPTSAEQVGRILALCATMRVGVVPQGGRTGLAGGASTVRGELIVSLDRMVAIESVSVASRTAIQAGCTLAMLDDEIAPHDLAAGIDLGARGTATIGGMVATNAGGIDAFRYGTMRERVLGLEVVLPSGQIYCDLSRVRKDNAGLPIRQLFIGSEGVLGVITRVVLALVPADNERHAALAVFADMDAAITLMRQVQAGPRAQLVAAEVMSGNHIALTASSLGVGQLAGTDVAAIGLLLAVTGSDPQAARDELEHRLAESAERGALVDCVVPKNAAEERDLWRIREDWAVDRMLPGGLWYDVSVPIDRIAVYLAQLQRRLVRHDPRLSIYVVGHLADGNIHVTVNAQHPLTGRYDEIAPLVYDSLRELGGSFSAEHGIGLEKRASLEHWSGEQGIGLMRSIKAVFDPAGIMNPGKVLNSPRAAGE